MTSLNASPDDLFMAALAAGQVPYTGRQIVTFTTGTTASDMVNALGVLGPMAAASDFAGSDVDLDNIGDAATLLFEETGTAILTPAGMPFGISSDALVAQTAAIANIEPEVFVFPTATAAPLPEAEATATWGLVVTGASSSPYSGKGIKVAVLDTGLDLLHPAFAGRQITSSSFIPNQSVQDLNGHGTHCIGTACGPLSSGGVPRFGIAHEAHIFAGKVLSNSGMGSSGSVLAGINWAIANGCHIISMSLGAAVAPQRYYEEAAQRALAAGALIIAAAGNESRRPGHIAPTTAPANSPGVVSVAAIDPQLQIANFSSGGKVEIAAPGVDVFSTLPLPRGHGVLSGTSMATPHVAGIAALWAESSPSLRGAALAAHLANRAQHLSLPAADVGKGLAQA